LAANCCLTSLTGLENITSLGGDLSIDNNYALTSLTGLENITSIGGDLSIEDNIALTSLTELENITSIGGDLSIEFSYALISLTGLENIGSIEGDLELYYNPSLTSLAGLENLTSIGGDLEIYSNHTLTSLMGLENLDSIGGRLSISENEALTSQAGLDNIDAHSIADLWIIFNTSLSACAVQSICDYLAAPNGTVEIYGNAPGCNSPEEVEEACAVGVVESAVSGQRSAVIAFPNPTEGISHFAFHISQYQFVSLKIYDVHGREVAALLDQKLSAGEHEVRWDATGLPAGMYFVRLQAGSEISALKFIKVE